MKIPSGRRRYHWDKERGCLVEDRAADYDFVPCEMSPGDMVFSAYIDHVKTNIRLGRGPFVNSFLTGGVEHD